MDFQGKLPYNGYNRFLSPRFQPELRCHHVVGITAATRGAIGLDTPSLGPAQTLDMTHDTARHLSWPRQNICHMEPLYSFLVALFWHFFGLLIRTGKHMKPDMDTGTALSHSTKTVRTPVLILNTTLDN